jgi:hypothetical protein
MQSEKKKKKFRFWQSHAFLCTFLKLSYTCKTDRTRIIIVITGMGRYDWRTVQKGGVEFISSFLLHLPSSGSGLVLRKEVGALSPMWEQHWLPRWYPRTYQTGLSICLMQNGLSRIPSLPSKLSAKIYAKLKCL